MLKHLEGDFLNLVTFQTHVEENVVGDTLRTPLALTNSSGLPLTDLKAKLLPKGTVLRSHGQNKSVLEKARLLVLTCCDSVTLASKVIVDGCDYAIEAIVDLGVNSGVTVLELKNAT